MIYFWECLIAIEILILGIVTIGSFTLKSKRWLFWRIQFLSGNLMVIGWFVCLSPWLAKTLWIFWNDDDGAIGTTYWARYRWLAWRNPVDNFKHVKWTQVVSSTSDDLTYKTWTWFGKEYYYKAGWMSDSYCAFSIGAGRGY